MTKTRKIKIRISAAGSRLQTEAMEMELVPMENEKAVALYRKLCEAIRSTILTP